MIILNLYNTWVALKWLDIVKISYYAFKKMFGVLFNMYSLFFVILFTNNVIFMILFGGKYNKIFINSLD